MSAVAGVWVEFFDRTGHKLARKPVRLQCVVARLASVRFHGSSAVVLQRPCQIAAQAKREKGLERCPVPFRRPRF
jgi:hypothetical protein